MDIDKIHSPKLDKTDALPTANSITNLRKKELIVYCDKLGLLNKGKREDLAKNLINRVQEIRNDNNKQFDQIMDVKYAEDDDDDDDDDLMYYYVKWDGLYYKTWEKESTLFKMFKDTSVELMHAYWIKALFERKKNVTLKYLKELCQPKKLSHYGSKQDMKQRIIDWYKNKLNQRKDKYLNDDICYKCKKYNGSGLLLCCDGCEKAFHLSCIGLDSAPLTDTWYCSYCSINQNNGMFMISF